MGSMSSMNGNMHNSYKNSKNKFFGSKKKNLNPGETDFRVKYKTEVNLANGCFGLIESFRSVNIGLKLVIVHLVTTALLLTERLKFVKSFTSLQTTRQRNVFNSTKTACVLTEFAVNLYIVQGIDNEITVILMIIIEKRIN